MLDDRRSGKERVLAKLQAESTHEDVLRAGISPGAFEDLVAFFCRRIFTMVVTLRHVRLRVATTACTYFQRFFCLRSMKQHDPRFVLAACIYIAGAPVLLAFAVSLHIATLEAHGHVMYSINFEL